MEQGGAHLRDQLLARLHRAREVLAVDDDRARLVLRGLAERRAPEQAEDGRCERRLLGGEVGDVRQVRGLELDLGEIALELGRQPPRLLLDEGAELVRVQLDGGAEVGGRLPAGVLQLALGAREIAEPLEDEPEVVVRPGVLRVALDDVLEAAPGLLEAAEIEEGDRALVAGVQVVGLGGERGLEAGERLARAAQVVQRLALEQREPRPERAGLRVGGGRRAQPRALEAVGAAARVLEAGLGVVVRRGEPVDVEVGGAGERLGIVGVEGERAREGGPRLVEARQLLQGGGAVVVGLDSVMSSSSYPNRGRI